MSLKTICQTALRRIGGFDVPSTFFGSSVPTAELCLALAQEEGNALERDHRWSALRLTYTFPTVAGTSLYSLPADFRAFANSSHWDRTNRFPLQGPGSPAVWQVLRSGLVATSATRFTFRLYGTQLELHPVPTSVVTIAYDYYSKSWITKQVDSSSTDSWTADADTAKLDEEVLTAGLRWRFMEAKGFPFEAAYKQYLDRRDSALANEPRGVIDFSARQTNLYANLPDGNYG